MEGTEDEGLCKTLKHGPLSQSTSATTQVLVSSSFTIVHHIARPYTTVVLSSETTMRPSTILPLALAIAGTTYAIPFPFRSQPSHLSIKHQDFDTQSPIMAPSLPNTSPSTSAPPPSTDEDDTTIIADILPSVSAISIFASLTRSCSTTSALLSSTSQNITVLAPSNSILASLPRKPWEEPEDYAHLGANAYTGAEGEGRAQKNLDRFVEAHVVRGDLGVKESRLKTVQGGEVWVEEKNGKIVVMPDQVEVIRVAEVVGNGEVWVLGGVLNYGRD